MSSGVKSPLGGKIVLLFMLTLVFAFGYAISLIDKRLTDTFLIMRIVGFSIFWGLMELALVRRYLADTREVSAELFNPLYSLLTIPLFITVSHPEPMLAFIMYVLADISYYLFKPKYLGAALEKPFTRCLNYIKISKMKFPIIYLLLIFLVILFYIVKLKV